MKSNVHPAQILSCVGLGPSSSSKTVRVGIEVERGEILPGDRADPAREEKAPPPPTGQNSTVSWKCRGPRKESSACSSERASYWPKLFSTLIITATLVSSSL